jgi:hypothetical protein
VEKWHSASSFEEELLRSFPKDAEGEAGGAADQEGDSDSEVTFLCVELKA